MKNDTKIQWHSGFVAAMKMELMDDAERLLVNSEYNLGEMPLRVDFLVIKKEASLRIKNNIGEIFRKHNLIEFKNPSDSLNLDSLYKATAYACLYKTQTRNHTRTISPDSITISLLRATYPAGLFKALKRDGYTWDNSHNGIFILSEGKHTLFRTQIIVINQLKRDEHRWIKALSDNLTTEDARELVSQIDELSSDEEKEHADAVLQVAIRANRAAFTQVKEEEKMFEALKELMADEIEEEVEKRVKNALSQTRIQGLQEGREEGRKEGREVGRKEGWREGRKEGREVGRKEGREVGRKEGIHGTILILSEIGMTKETIKEKIQAQYKLTAEQAQKYMLDDTVS